MKRNNKKGFTIVELVIVIAVIAILSAVLIPTFGTIITDAQDTARDQEAKNLYTTYVSNTILAGGTAAQEGVILVDGFKYQVTGGQIVLDGKQTTAEMSGTVLVCNHDPLTTSTKCDHCGTCGNAASHSDTACSVCGKTK